MTQKNKDKEPKEQFSQVPGSLGKTDAPVPEDVKPDISEHITYKEATHSDTADELGIDNNPPEDILAVMRVTAEKVFEPLRRFWKCPIGISSFYRSPEFNAALEKDKTIKASKNSQHLTGEAIDIDANIYGNISNRNVFEYIRDHSIFDQLIWEYGDDNNPEWVHVSYITGPNRMQVLRHFKVGIKTYYEELNGEKSSFKQLN